MSKDTLREDFHGAVESRRVFRESDSYLRMLQRGDGFAYGANEQWVVEWYTGWGFSEDLGKALMYYFGVADLPLADCYALAVDLRDMMASDGMGDPYQAAAELLRRIGGPDNIRSYVRTIEHPPVPDVV